MKFKNGAIICVAAVVVAAVMVFAFPNYEKIDAAADSSASLEGRTSSSLSTSVIPDAAGSSYEAETESETDSVQSETDTVQNETDTTQKAGESTLIEWRECSDVYYVTADSLNIRAEPSLDSEVVSVVSLGTELSCNGQDPDGVWTRIDYNGQNCYAATEYLSGTKPEIPQVTDVTLNPSWRYADYSKINSGVAKLYRADSALRNGITVCVNAGHGTSGGESVKTLCHPDGSAKVTGGSTAAGATTATAVSYGTTMLDGTPEAKVTLALALALKDKLLARGYDVLMIREGDDVQLDNIARTVMANNMADCHLALHWDSSDSNKGAFYCSVPSNSSYRSMEPVASHWQEHNALGSSLITGLRNNGVKIFSDGSMEMDLTQTSYSTVPSVDIELGDRASDHSSSAIDNLAVGLADGVDGFFGR